MPLVGGMFVKEADPLIIEELKRRGVLWKARHARARVSALLALRHAAAVLRARVVVRAHDGIQASMMARNGRVDWHPPEVGGGRFGEWLENNIDWAISRDRYWGTPLPIWVCDADAAHVDRDRQLRRARGALGRAARRTTSIRTSRTSTRTRGRALSRDARARCVACPR